MTPDEADEALAKYGPVDLAYAVKHAAEQDVDPVWRAALGRARARERRAAANYDPATSAAVTLEDSPHRP